MTVRRRQDPTRAAHYVEAFIDQGAGLFGWQCFTCGAEQADLLSFYDAERKRDAHMADTQEV